MGVKANTKMAEELMTAMEDKCEKVNFSLTFPEVFDDLYSVDADFEMVAPNTIQHVRVFYRQNVVTKSFAAIFANHCLEFVNLQYVISH